MFKDHQRLIEQLPLYLASGDWPDFFINPLTNADINSYGVEGKMLVNYNDYLEYMPNLEACFKKYPTARKVVTNTDGTIYQLPFIRVFFNFLLCDCPGNT